MWNFIFPSNSPFTRYTQGVLVGTWEHLPPPPPPWRTYLYRLHVCNFHTGRTVVWCVELRVRVAGYRQWRDGRAGTELSKSSKKCLHDQRLSFWSAVPLWVDARQPVIWRSMYVTGSQYSGCLSKMHCLFFSQHEIIELCTCVLWWWNDWHWAMYMCFMMMKWLTWTNLGVLLSCRGKSESDHWLNVSRDFSRSGKVSPSTPVMNEDEENKQMMKLVEEYASSRISTTTWLLAGNVPRTFTPFILFTGRFTR